MHAAVKRARAGGGGVAVHVVGAISRHSLTYRNIYVIINVPKAVFLRSETVSVRGMPRDNEPQELGLKSFAAYICAQPNSVFNRSPS